MPVGRTEFGGRGIIVYSDKREFCGEQDCGAWPVTTVLRVWSEPWTVTD